MNAFPARNLVVHDLPDVRSWLVRVPVELCHRHGFFLIVRFSWTWSRDKGKSLSKRKRQGKGCVGSMIELPTRGSCLPFAKERFKEPHGNASQEITRDTHSDG